MKTTVDTAIILRRIDFGEADRILTVLTAEHGKVSAIAKGARRSKSKLAGGLELFSVSTMNLIDGKRELKTIASAQLVRHYSSISNSLERTMFGYECLKLIDKSTEQDCELGYFNLLDALLLALSDSDVAFSVTKTWFYASLLHLKGVHMNLERQLGGAEFDEDTSYVFDYEEMAFLAHAQGIYLPKHIKYMRLLSKVSAPSHLLHIAEVDTIAGQVELLLKQTVEVTNN